METTRLFVEQSGLSSDQYTVTFQSRLGRAKWLEPSTEETLKEMAGKGLVRRYDYKIGNRRIVTYKRLLPLRKREIIARALRGVTL